MNINIGNSNGSAGVVGVGSGGSGGVGGADCDSNDDVDSMDLFKESFKYYKAKSPTPNFGAVIDFDSTRWSTDIVKEAHLGKCIFNDIGASRLDLPLGLRPKNTWRIYNLVKHPGLVVIRNPWTPDGQRYWIARCLRDYSRKPNLINLNERLFPPNVIEDWWEALQNVKEDDIVEKRRLQTSMRWATLGYHHNWDTKVYSESKHTLFPPDLSAMCYFFATALGFQNFIAEAAIINYYPIGTTLAGHTDHSEYNLDAPLFSFSFGQTAIFLIGGKTKAEKPTAIYLKSGDVIVMSKESRLCYHAVPRVMKEHEQVAWSEAPLTSNAQNPQAEPHYKRQKIDFDTIVNECNIDTLLYQQTADEEFWAPFGDYIEEARININVRQVLNSETGSCSSTNYEDEANAAATNANANANDKNDEQENDNDKYKDIDENTDSGSL